MIATLVSAMLISAVLLVTARILRPGAVLADVVVAFDTLLLLVVSLVAADAAFTQRTAFIDVTLVVGLLGFLGTATAAVYLRRLGEER